eukprot:SAG31_NODE_1012_length_10379_cov_3.699319_5_plen_147_part_00
MRTNSITPHQFGDLVWRGDGDCVSTAYGHAPELREGIFFLWHRTAAKPATNPAKQTPKCVHGAAEHSWRQIRLALLAKHDGRLERRLGLNVGRRASGRRTAVAFQTGSARPVRLNFNLDASPRLRACIGHCSERSLPPSTGTYLLL